MSRVCADIGASRRIAEEFGGVLEPRVDSIYLGGGTPTVLSAEHLQRIFDSVRQEFSVEREAEITVECAPGTLGPDLISCLVKCGVNRVSLGVQSFVDAEAAAVGRLHKRSTVLDDIARLRSAGIANINVDLIAGLPHQNEQSWNTSMEETIATGVPHVSVYMLEIDEDSRLGRELIAGGKRYHAHFVPDEDAMADFYLAACEALNRAGIPQYEISNFAHSKFQSRHNLKYWTRQPYFGFGVDAHSMLYSSISDSQAVRFATTDVLDKFIEGGSIQGTVVSRENAIEEEFFLGLRLNGGVNLRDIEHRYGESMNWARVSVQELTDEGLLELNGEHVRLTIRGRLLSNDVFQRFLAPTNSPMSS